MIFRSQTSVSVCFGEQENTGVLGFPEADLSEWPTLRKGSRLFMYD